MNKVIYPWNNHFMYDLPETQGCEHWARLYPDKGVVILQRMKKLSTDKGLWPAKDIAVFRVKD